MLKNFKFEYEVPHVIEITDKLIREKLREVQVQLRSRTINGGKQRLDMAAVCDADNKCGTAACIGGWLGIFLLGTEDEVAVHGMFDSLTRRDPRLSELFHEYGNHHPHVHNDPLIAARAIENYLNGKECWPEEMRPMEPLAKKKAKKK